MYVYSDFKLPVAEIILDFSDDLQSNFWCQIHVLKLR
jgi:hypothetical protein